MRVILICTVFGFLVSGFGQAQDLKSLRWQNRVLLLYTDSLSNPEYRQMEQALLADQSAAEDRKLIVFTLLGQQVSQGLPAEIWREVGPLQKVKQDSRKGFGLELVGLDGGVKFRFNKAVRPEALWVRIDGMPMRKVELKDQGGP